MRVLFLIPLIVTLVACSDDKSSSPSKPSEPAGQDDKKQEEQIEVSGPVLEKPTTPAVTNKKDEPVKDSKTLKLDSIPVIKNDRSLPADPTRVSSGKGARVDSNERSIQLETIISNIQTVVANLGKLEPKTHNEPLANYIERARLIFETNAQGLEKAELAYCLAKYSTVAPKNTSICYYKFGMGTDAEEKEFVKLAALYKQEMFTSGDMKMIALEEEYCDNQYKVAMPRSQTKCYFIMGYGTPEEYATFIDTSIKLEEEKVAAGQRKLDELARQYRESKKKND